MNTVRTLLIWGVLGGVLLAGMLLPAALSAGVLSDQAADAADADLADLSEARLPSASVVTDSAGNPIAHLYQQNRTVLKPEQISQAMKAAAVPIEDRRFFDHHGVDWPGTLRAV